MLLLCICSSGVSVVRAYCALSDLAGAAEHDDEHEGKGHGENVDHPEPGTLLSGGQHLCGQARLRERQRGYQTRHPDPSLWSLRKHHKNARLLFDALMSPSRNECNTTKSFYVDSLCVIPRYHVPMVQYIVVSGLVHIYLITSPYQTVPQTQI